MTWYTLLKYIHVLLAITAVGSNITYAVWNARASMEPAHAAFALKGIAFIDRRVANPAYALLLVTGLVLIMIGQTWGLGNGWVASALILFALLIVVAVGFYSRVMKRQIEALETEGQASANYQRLTRQAQIYGIASLLIVLAIVFMMVVKPF
jgi:uncharacterized membrane protein